MQADEMNRHFLGGCMRVEVLGRDLSVRRGDKWKEIFLVSAKDRAADYGQHLILPIRSRVAVSPYTKPGLNRLGFRAAPSSPAARGLR